MAGAGVRVMGELRELDGLKEERMRNVPGAKRRGKTSVEEGLSEVSGVGGEVIWVTTDAPPLDSQRLGNGVFGR